MKQRIITIHSVKELYRYGYESTQLARAKVARNLGVDYTHIITSPQIRDSWKDYFYELGFLDKEILCVPFSFSDIAHDKLSVLPNKIKVNVNDVVNVSSDGFVTSVELGDGSGKIYYTSGPFLFESYTSKDIELYNSKGEVVLKMKHVDPFKEPTPVRVFYPGYIFLKDGEIYAEEDLLVYYLALNARDNDLFIKDQQSIPTPNLYRYMENTNKNFYEVIHENVLRNLDISNLRMKTNYLVASEVLTEKLIEMGYNVKFIPPMFTENYAEVSEVGPILDYCLVGHMGEVKNVEFAINAFIKLYNLGSNVKLTLYGGSFERIEELKSKFNITPNIKFEGVVSSVPYDKHQCYLSSSYTELFANAFIEAASFGLIGLLSNVDIAHKFYGAKSNSILLFSNELEFLESILLMSRNDFKLSNKDNLDLAKKYSLGNLSRLYLDILERK